MDLEKELNELKERQLNDQKNIADRVTKLEQKKCSSLETYYKDVDGKLYKETKKGYKRVKPGKKLRWLLLDNGLIVDKEIPTNKIIK